MRWLGVLAVFLGLGVSLAQIWYYAYDEDPYLAPDQVDFVPTAEQQACAAIENPSPAAGPLRVNLRPLQQGCPGPPVVVWGTSNGRPTYAILLTVKFWGEGRTTDPDSGIEALIQLIEQGYVFRLKARPRRNLRRVNVQYHPPFITPPVDAPLPFTSGWIRWQRRQNVPLDRPQVNDVAQYDFFNFNATCLNLYSSSTCWTARLTWALPVRLELNGYESSGSYRIRVIPDLFYEKNTATTLAVRRGHLTKEKPRILPAFKKGAKAP